MKKDFMQTAVIISNDRIAKATYEMKLDCDATTITAPGQFINIDVPGYFLRRPISVCDAEDRELTIIYKVVGQGTLAMSQMGEGTQLNILTGLGNGFDPERAKSSALLVGGGCGVAPLYMLAKKLVAMNKSVQVILGFNTKDEIFLEQKFLDLNDAYEFGCEGFEGDKPEVKVAVTTVDGSYGVKGFVTDAIAQIYGSTKTSNADKHYETGNAANDGGMVKTDETMRPGSSKMTLPYYYACGPLPMLKALKKSVGDFGELSLEERMGCGFGACVGCSVKTAKGFKKVCADGPVFPADEVLEET
ncbi:MAG: dihydroorotate dehydrogenase electron transfer subunit [Lachnospiraceae bacterium]|nr:dihydroorotate dehydrogenase electron transfer subunit [Lachnospiraceae bacterium]